jgi:hypothetical protein
MSSVWKQRYVKAAAKRSALASGTTTSALKREKEQRRTARLEAARQNESEVA